MDECCLLAGSQAHLQLVQPRVHLPRECSSHSGLGPATSTIRNCPTGQFDGGNWFLPQAATGCHWLPQASIGSHRLPWAPRVPTGCHGLPWAPTGSHRLLQVLTGSHCHSVLYPHRLTISRAKDYGLKSSTKIPTPFKSFIPSVLS